MQQSRHCSWGLVRMVPRCQTVGTSVSSSGGHRLAGTVSCLAECVLASNTIGKIICSEELFK